MSTDLHVVHRLGATASARQARRIISSEVAPVVEAARVDVLKLLITELLAGRLRRGRRTPGPGAASGTPSHTIVDSDQADDAEVLLDVEAGEVIRCTIVDRGPADLPSACSMRILELLSSRWGMVRERGATRLWFETSRSEPARGQRPG